jgi:hypothetical protein
MVNCIDMSAIESGVTELYKDVKAWKKKNKTQDEKNGDDEEMEDEQGKGQLNKFEIAIVGGRKKDEDEEMDMT